MTAGARPDVIVIVIVIVIVWQRQQPRRARYDVTHDLTTCRGNRRAVISLLRTALSRPPDRVVGAGS